MREYRCEAGHVSGSVNDLTACPRMVQGQPCTAKLGEVGATNPRPPSQRKRLNLCHVCLGRFRGEWPGLGAREISRLNPVSSRGRRTCDHCQNERAVASVPNLERASR